jgi:cation transporter-like permease
MDKGLKLRQEFAARERAALRGGTLRQAKNGVTGALGGLFSMLLAIVITVVVTRLSPFYWHSFVLEFLFAAVAGFVIQRSGGGLLKGVFLLPAAYGAAFLMRRYGWDPSSWLAPDPALIAGHGHLLAICCLVGCGGVFGYTQEGRR